MYVRRDGAINIKVVGQKRNLRGLVIDNREDRVIRDEGKKVRESMSEMQG